MYRNESFIFSATTAVQAKVYAWLYEHKTLGKDKVIGSAEIDVSYRSSYVAV